MYQVLIVDDEFLARKLLQSYVEKDPELSTVGLCCNAAEAFKAINTHKVDILLLDIHMPDLNGVDFARTLHNIPAIIFTTAYSQYALESYEVSATDYLLKPIALPRFIEAIEKAKTKIQLSRSHTEENQKTEHLHNNPDTEVSAEVPIKGSEPDDREFMLVKADYKLYKINYADLLYVEGQHEYVSFYTKEKRITALYALKTLEEQLPADRFIRVHKSYIVAINQIQEIEQLSIVVAGIKIPIGGIYREALMKKLGAN